MLRHKAQRREAAGARRVVFEEIKSDGQSIEQPSRNLFVAAFGVAVTAASPPRKCSAHGPGIVIFGQRSERVLRKSASAALVPLHAAADNRDRLRASTALGQLRIDTIGGADAVGADGRGGAVEKAVIGAATKFAISDKFEAQSLLQPDRIGSGGIFGGGERGRVDLALGKAGAFAQQIGRTQQSADMLGAEWRFSRGRIGRRLRAECHEAPPISGILTPPAFAIAANSSHSFAGIGMPVLRRAASVRLPRSPGSKISSNPARRGRALMIAASPSASVSKSTSGRNVSISITSIAVLAVCRAPFCGPSAGAWIGAAASTLASISNMKAKPEPLGPPSGSRISACLASVVGSPVAVSTAPSGSAAPVARACKILPFEIVLADMSSAISPLLLGTAIAIGLVAMLATRAP